MTEKNDILLVHLLVSSLTICGKTAVKKLNAIIISECSSQRYVTLTTKSCPHPLKHSLPNILRKMTQFPND
jgi:hypothetical protein